MPLFWQRVSCNSGWLTVYHVAEASLKLLIFLCSPQSARMIDVLQYTHLQLDFSVWLMISLHSSDYLSANTRPAWKSQVQLPLPLDCLLGLRRALSHLAFGRFLKQNDTGRCSLQIQLQQPLYSIAKNLGSEEHMFFYKFPKK